MRKINTHDFKLANRSTARDINRQIALNLIREHQPISRADLARRMGVARGIVTCLVRELITDGLIYQGPKGDGPLGRKPTPLFVRTCDRLAIAVDVRFSRTSMMLADLGGRQIALETFETRLSPGEFVTDLAQRVRRLVQAHANAGRCEGIGLVVPGIVDRRTRRVLHSPQLGWFDLDLRDSISAEAGLPVYIENAPIACALAQMWLGPDTVDGGDFVYVTVSDGVGAGVIVNGDLVRGHAGSAGEFGHITIDPRGPRCVCGSLGCWRYTRPISRRSRAIWAVICQIRTRGPCYGQVP